VHVTHSSSHASLKHDNMVFFFCSSSVNLNLRFGIFFAVDGGTMCCLNRETRAEGSHWCSSWCLPTECLKIESIRPMMVIFYSRRLCKKVGHKERDAVQNLYFVFTPPPLNSTLSVLQGYDESKCILIIEYGD